MRKASIFSAHCLVGFRGMFVCCRRCFRFLAKSVQGRSLVTIVSSVRFVRKLKRLFNYSATFSNGRGRCIHLVRIHLLLCRLNRSVFVDFIVPIPMCRQAPIESLMNANGFVQKTNSCLTSRRSRVDFAISGILPATHSSEYVHELSSMRSL